ncbi:MAG: 4Fe-4S binding protein [Bacillota bacterium]|jgi:2-oxoglutarate ferredoxin oxidoreductase subunit delta
MSKRALQFTGERYQAPRGTWTVFVELCKGCGLCIEKCPTHVIRWSDRLSNYGTPRVEVDADGCIVCNQCAMHCPDAAISVEVQRKASHPDRK